MRCRALTVSANDWTFGSGGNNYVTGNAAAAVLIRTRVLSFLGNCFFDTTAGINWFQFLGGKDQLGLNLAISGAILGTLDDSGNQIVTGINQLSVTLTNTNRAFQVSYQVETIYSTLVGQFVYSLNGSA